MNSHQQSWQRLAAAARANRDGRDETAPYGFATRIANQAFATSSLGSWSLMEKFAVRGLIAACAFSLAAMALGYVSTSSERDDDMASTDTIGEILDLT